MPASADAELAALAELSFQSAFRFARIWLYLSFPSASFSMKCKQAERREVLREACCMLIARISASEWESHDGCCSGCPASLASPSPKVNAARVCRKFRMSYDVLCGQYDQDVEEEGIS